MTAKPVKTRPAFDRDVETAAAHLLHEAGGTVAFDFIDSIERLLNRVSHFPLAGSPRYDHALGISGLRCALLRRFSYLMFYFERDDCIEAVRLLHAKRDVAADLIEPEPEYPA